MTPDQLNDELDVMQQATGGDFGLMPGRIRVESGHWVAVLSAVRATCSRLDDGLRHRDIKIHVGSKHVTAVLTRAEAGDRGAPAGT